MILFNLLIFAIGAVVLWFAAGLVISGVNRFSRSVRISKFATSFLLLGLLTSIGEISVGINSILDKKPEIFVGNLIGGSFVILLFIVPILAIFGRGITLGQYLQPKKLSFFLVLIVAPSFLILDGYVSRYDGLLLILLYGLFFNLFQKSEKLLEKPDLKQMNVPQTEYNLAKIVIGAILIFLASKILVDKTIYFASILEIPPFMISILILSIGTNLPELIIAANSIKNKQKSIAFGDYIGSAATNSLLFGTLVLIYGPFEVASNGFDFTLFILLLGYICFFSFAHSRKHLSLMQGVVLIVIYLFFFLVQTTEIFLASPKI
ncbi:MAG: hypothetical protein U1C57_02810 [Candidatus Doudnabacteria bacterium]|nr:hypothetical protein [bacterium]MDZ4244014.1 hypothetical protein [Candidatus Doudnabacteria bacterium]